MKKLEQLAAIGQSVWYDYIRRTFLEGGGLQRLIDEGVRGVTSNPAIFDKAIAGSKDYDEQITTLVAAGKSVAEIYEALVIADIRVAADQMRPVYERTEKMDGFVSLEVSPDLADNTGKTIADAQRLFEAVSRANLMIKVPATEAGIPAVQDLIAGGINVNVTLLFGVDNYRQVAEAFLDGLERLAERGPTVAGGHPASSVASVASFFVSRVDTAVDSELAKVGNTELQGRIAVANAKIAYAAYCDIYSTERWKKLAALGARPQRLLWASTGTKNPLYADTLYMDALIGQQTVNTAPPATLDAFLDHGQVKLTLSEQYDQAQADLEKLAGLGVDLSNLTRRLQREGVDSFVQAFHSLMNSVAEKRDRILARRELVHFSFGTHELPIELSLAELREQRQIERIWKHDHTVWKDDPTEIANRLGWLHSPENMGQAVADIGSFVEEIRKEGLKKVLLLGMGGSSLAPEVYRKAFGVRPGFLALDVLDSTDPGAVAASGNVDPAHTLFVVSTKSGGTVETVSFLKHFYTLTAETVGRAQCGRHFVAITDPGSSLETMAERLAFRRIFLNDPNIGGRYSALSYFGLVPAALLGVDLRELLDRAAAMACNAEGCDCSVAGDNSAARLGIAIAELVLAGRDKLTVIASPTIVSFGAWLEQLLAESTGKDGTGVVPIDGEPLLSPDQYGDDRCFVYLRLDGEDARDGAAQAIHERGHPLARLELRDTYDLGGEFFRWEMATAVAGARLGINPFDQPNVEAAKAVARDMVSSYQRQGRLPRLDAAYESEGAAVYWDRNVTGISDALREFLQMATELGDDSGAKGYVAIQAYITPDEANDRAAHALRAAIQRRTQWATTFGYGPRFLHSTGQLHKGDAGHGLFVQITDTKAKDIPIPDEAGGSTSSITFGVLKLAQAMGDRQALLRNGRKVIRFHFDDATQGIQRLAKELE